MTLLLQITQTAMDTVANSALTNPAITAPAEPLNLLTLIMKGGWIMIPLIILSILTVYFAVERFLVIRRASRIDQNFMSNIRDYLLNGKMEPAVMLCRNTNTPIARLLGKGIKRIGKPIKEVESAVESEGRLEIYKLDRNMNYLAIIAAIAPMMGFVGTISGVIKIFYTISVEKVISIDGIAGGLYEKMITSAAGLLIGIFAYVCFNLLNNMIDRVSYMLEANAVDFIDLIQEPTA
ncbi:MAG TPA: MotA/TolQ/ExbB proton channel family protein [Chitinophagales bacterium]|nr:MotA/TolQ/ExbB proton channel family protein [Chitinophagales bacterium]